MIAMFPVVLFLFAFLFPSVAAAQTPPPRAPVDPSKQPNPIVTFVEAKEMRFGGTAPEQLEIRGARGLLFDKEGQITIYWQEEGVGHVAMASLARQELFRVVDDLL